VPEAAARVTGSVREALAAAGDALAAAGVESPRLDAELLLAEATGLDRAALATDPDRGVEAVAARSFGAMVRRRVAREPVAYILGSKGFRHIELRCDRRALIPRPETELLVEVALERRPSSVLDVGTGTGAIALAVADELPEAEVVAVDTSAAALDLARENAAALGLTERVEFSLGGLPEPGHFDLVLANLPYVPAGDRRSLAPEITRYEPAEALFSGSDGLDAIRGLLAALGGGGEGALETSAVALEIGQGQGEGVAALVASAGFGDVEVRRDLAGIERVVVGWR
jgi:release factor glutamine methyltransferase